MNMIVAGSRTLTSRHWHTFIYRRLDFFSQNLKKLVVFGGECEGVDEIGHAWADDRGWPFVPFPADWENIDLPGAVVRVNRAGKRYNLLAGYWRNEEMARQAQGLVLFWADFSPGSRDMLARARAHNLKIRIEIPEGECYQVLGPGVQGGFAIRSGKVVEHTPDLRFLHQASWVAAINILRQKGLNYYVSEGWAEGG